MTTRAQFKPIRLDGKLFEKRMDAEAFVRQKVEAGEFNEKDPLWFSLIKNHPEKEIKIGPGIMSFRRKTHPINKRPCLFIVRVDGTEIDFSWKSCVSQKAKTSDDNLKAAMRQGVYTQVQEFKDRQYRDLGKCKLCEARFKNRSDGHVDHEIQFQTLMRDFITANADLSVPQSFTDDLNTNQATFSNDPLSRNFALKWFEYHENNAALRLICKTCNLTREKI